MQSETVCRAALLEFPEENDLFADFLDCHMEVLHTGIDSFQVIQFVIVCGEQCLGALSVFMYEFDYRPGNGHSVVSGCTSADFIQKHKRTLGKIVQNH